MAHQFPFSLVGETAKRDYHHTTTVRYHTIPPYIHPTMTTLVLPPPGEEFFGSSGTTADYDQSDADCAMDTTADETPRSGSSTTTGPLNCADQESLVVKEEEKRKMDHEDNDANSGSEQSPTGDEDEDADDQQPASTPSDGSSSMDEEDDGMNDCRTNENDEQEQELATEANLHDDDDEEEEHDTASQPADTSPTLGGIVNLMNTCYMASAVQMLASADALVALLRRTTDTTNNNNNNDNESLRHALVDVWDRLERGETVQPDDLKRLIDDRSPLFAGSEEQQDAHEFLTTLLDLLDADYKAKNHQQEEDQTDVMDNEESTVDEEHSDKDDGQRIDVDAENRDSDHEETPSKRIKTCMSQQETAKPFGTAQENNLPNSKSFSELSMDQIEQLLHGSSADTSREGVVKPPPPPSAPPSPLSCRLVGGRMNPTAESSSAAGGKANPFWNRYPMVAMETNAAGTSTTTMHKNHHHHHHHHARENNAQEDPWTGLSTTDARAEEKEEVEPTSTNVVATAPSAITTSDATTTTTTISSPIDDCFTTKVRVRLTCDSCKYTRTKDETYLHWSLEMPSTLGDAGTSVDEVVRRFYASERREVKCEKCFGESATQTSQIVQLPKLLLLHFKRFVVKVSEDYSDISYEKNSSAVSFEPVIDPAQDLEEHMATDCAVTPGAQYHLRSVVNHHGSSVHFGHYTADAHRATGVTGREWHRFNDTFVSKISEQQAAQESSQSAYLVLYELE